MGDAIFSIIFSILGMLGMLSPIIILYLIHKAIYLSRTYRSDSYRQKQLEQGRAKLEEAYEKYSAAERAFAEKEAMLRESLKISTVDDSSTIQQTGDIDQQVKKRMAVDKLLKEKAEQKYKDVASILYMSYALIFNTFYQKRQEILEYVGDSLRNSERKKIEAYTTYIEDADQAIKTLRKEHKLSVTPKLFKDARAIEKGYDEGKINTVFPYYFTGFSMEYHGLFVMRSASRTIKWGVFFVVLGAIYYGFRLYDF